MNKGILIWFLVGACAGVIYHSQPDDCDVVSEQIPVPVVHVPPVVVTYAPYKKGIIDTMDDPSEAWVDCGKGCID